jgi:hypothetical protein
MPPDERVVIRSSWLAVVALLAPAGVVLLVIQISWRSFGSVIPIILFLATMTASLRFLHYIELTPHGIGIHTFGVRRVPWANIGAVEQVRKYGSYELTIYDRVENRSRRLSAPRGVFGVGRGEQEQARELIEQWWIAHRGSPAPVPPVRAAQHETSGPPLDPYRPPPEG